MAKRRRRQRRITTTIVFLFLIVLAGLVCYLVWDSYFRNRDDDNEVKEQKTDQVIEDKVEKKGEESEESVLSQKESKDETKDETKDGKEQINYDGENPNQANTLTGVITRAENMGEQVVIRVNIDQYLDEGGCQLSLKRNDEIVYSDQTSVVAAAATATCEGFDVPISRIGEGNYMIEIVINSGDKTGTINGEVDV